MRLVPSTVTITRPADTNAYGAKDAVANSTSAPTVLTFSDILTRNGEEAYITKARLLTNQATCTARFRLHLYSVAPDAINDNGAFTLLWANRANRIGLIDFSAASTEGTGSDCAQALLTTGNGNLPLPFKCADGSNDIYGLLETLDVFTPASGQIIYIELSADN